MLGPQTEAKKPSQPSGFEFTVNLSKGSSKKKKKGKRSRANVGQKK